LLLITLATGLSAQPPIAPEEVARAWLKLVDGGQSANSWEQTGSPFKARSSEQAWQTMLNYIRRSVGPVESRKIASVQFSNSLLGAPDGEYALVRFNSAFVHKSSTLETLSLGSENNHWVVIGYFIK
jgi:hypothetical protein